METRKQKYWVIVASKDHVKKGIAGGFAQANHGKSSSLKRMRTDDMVIYYSGKQIMNQPEKCQAFTAIGRVKDEALYPAQMSQEFTAFRRNVDFMESRDVSILPLIPELEFIKNKKNWGYSFRFGFFEINMHDFDLISSRMLSHSHG